MPEETFISDDNQEAKVYKISKWNTFLTLFVATLFFILFVFMWYYLIMIFSDQLWLVILLMSIFIIGALLIPVTIILSRRLIITPKVLIYKNLFKKKIIPLNKIKLIGQRAYMPPSLLALPMSSASDMFDKATLMGNYSLGYRRTWIFWEDENNELRIQFLRITNLLKMGDHQELISNLFRLCPQLNQDKSLMEKFSHSSWFLFKNWFKW